MELESALPKDIIAKAHQVLALAKAAKCKIATAESCTGGLLASLFTDIEGLSHVFERGMVVYSDEAKCALLGIERALVDDCGAVSKDVAEAMASGALQRSEADIVIAVTGFAGPGGPNDEEGLVHFGILCRNGHRRHREEHFGKLGRDGVRIAALRVALVMLEEALA